jgi:translation initiation factor IF-2
LLCDEAVGDYIVEIYESQLNCIGEEEAYLKYEEIKRIKEENKKKDEEIARIKEEKDKKIKRIEEEKIEEIKKKDEEIKRLKEENNKKVEEIKRKKKDEGTLDYFIIYYHCHF